MPINEGANLGVARGRLTVDLSDLNNVRVATQQVGQEAERNLGRIATGAQRAEMGISGIAGAARNLIGAFGISIGAAGVIQMARFAQEVDAVATAYRRQEVAARALAGSQDRLIDLMETYERVTGGSVDQATALADVTRLQAVGFADTAEELEKFLTAARGISVATGGQQDYVISQLQLAIANQSTMLLDQLGLGVSEVMQRIAELRAQNSSLTEELAYQEAILGLAIEKYGELARSVEAQATGAERAARYWREWRLAVGQAVSPIVDSASGGIATWLEQDIERTQRWTDPLGKAMREASRQADIARAELGRAEEGLVQLQQQAEMGLINETAVQRQIQLIQEFTARVQELEEAERLAAIPLRERAIAARTGIGAQIREAPRSFQTPRFSDAQTQAIREWADNVQQIERQANTQRLDATQQYEAQRSSVIAGYERTIAREAEDFARNRARALADHEARLSEVRVRALAREADWAADLESRIADMREQANRRTADAQEDFDRQRAEQQAAHDERLTRLRTDGHTRIAELERDAQRQRERALAQHRDSLLSAAASLDARAVAQEMRRWHTAQAEQERALTERVNQERTNLADRIAEDEEAFQKQTAQQQAQFDRRLAREARDLQLRIDQEQKAVAKRLEEARKADEQRLTEMQDAFEKEQAQQAEDRAIRLGRMAEDHRDQLREMERAQGERIAQINRHAVEQRKTLDDTFQVALNELGIRTDRWLAENKRLTDGAIKDFDRWFANLSQIPADLSRSFPSLLDPTTLPNQGGFIGPLMESGAISPSVSNIVIHDGAIRIELPPNVNAQQLVDTLEQQLAEILQEIAGQ